MINILLLKNEITLPVDNFAARRAQTSLVNKVDIADFVKETDFDNKLKNINIKVTSNKTKHKILERGYGFSLGRMHFTGDDGCQRFLVIVPMLFSLTHQIEPFDTRLELNMSNLTTGGVILKSDNFVFAQKFVFHFIVTLFEIDTYLMNLITDHIILPIFFHKNIAYLVHSN